MAKVETNQRVVIKCPHCGYEYLPGEIFMPNNFLGQPVRVVRDALGKILYEEYKPGQELDLTEKFVCENCEKEFIIEATTSFKTKVQEEEVDFTTDTASLL